MVVALAAAGLAVGLAGCSSAPSSVSHASVSVAGNVKCGQTKSPPKAALTVPVTVSSVSGGQLVTVGLCVGSQGPYSFVVDTGSSKSIIDSSLAAALHLGGAGSTELGGSGCATTGNLVHVPTLHVKSVVIEPQTMVSTSLTDWAGRSVDGVLGSDVLGRFGALKLDLPRHSMTVAGGEGPAPTTHAIVVGQAGSSPPQNLVTGKVVDDVPLTVVQGPGTYAAFANMTVAVQKPYAFVVDTGSPVSSIDTTAGFTLKIASKGTASAPGGIGCSGTDTALAPVPMEIGSTTATLRLRSFHIVGPQRNGIIGYLGLDYVGQTGTVIIDYAGADMAFVSG
jgi:hypothetical protein